MRDAAMMDTIIFDLDGTLVDSCGVCSAILQDMIVARGHDHVIDHQYARGFMSHGGEAMVTALLGQASVDPVEDLIEFRDRYSATTTCVEALFSGVPEGLAGLVADGYRLAICSNKPQQLCNKVLRDTGLDEFFAVVVGGQAGIKPKPAPDLLDLTLAQLGADFARCVFVGDSELDHQTAASRGIPFHFVTYGYASAGWQPKDCGIYHDFSELSRALARSVVEAPV